MHTHVFPGMREALAHAKQKRRQKSRRAFLVGSFGSLVAGLSAGYVAGQTPAPATDLDIEMARKLAAGPMDDLLASWPTFLGVAEQACDDPSIMYGVCRLACHAATTSSQDPSLREALVQTLRVVPAPELRAMRELLLR